MSAPVNAPPTPASASPPASATILGLESRLVNAWPSFETETMEGWLVRFAGGYSRRANSATPFAPGASLDEAGLAQIVASFGGRGLVPVFRLTGLEEADTDGFLAARGYVQSDPSLVMRADIHPIDEETEGVVIETRPTEAWIGGAASAYGGAKDNPEFLADILARIRRPAAYATLVLDDRPVGWGIGVVERGWLGLYDIVVATDLRGLGLGRQIVRTLMEWGRGRGAQKAYLQVREENEIARALYTSLGFTDVYRYTHRVAS